MFDVSFSELMLIGIIALVVIGPQRLPKVARTIGHLVGRAQRYVNDVKTDIQREIDLDEISKVKSQMESAARSVQSSVSELGSSLSKPLEEAQQTMTDASKSFHDAMTRGLPDSALGKPSAAGAAATEGTPAGSATTQDTDAASPSVAATSTPVVPDTAPAPASAAKHGNAGPADVAPVDAAPGAPASSTTDATSTADATKPSKETPA